MTQRRQGVSNPRWAFCRAWHWRSQPLPAFRRIPCTGLSVSDIARLEEIWLLFPHTNGNGRRRYDEDDLKVAELVAQELQRDARPDDFEPYAAAMRALVIEEFNLFRKLAGDGPPALSECSN